MIATPEQLEDIKRKIQKLMSLGSSPNEHEAARALEMANALLLKYNLEMDEIEKQGAPIADPIVNEQYELGTHAFQWKILLANAIAQHNFCRLLVGHRNRHLYFVGRKTNVDATRDMFTWVTMQLLTLCQKDSANRPTEQRWTYDRQLGDYCYKTVKMDGLRWQTSWCMGATVRIAERLRGQREEQKKEHAGTCAIVLRHDQENQDYLDEHYGKNLKNKKVMARTNYSSVAYRAGSEAGDRVQLSRRSSTTHKSTPSLNT